ncbi:MAG: ribosome biogenesis GTPase YlqF [Ruminococcaceae bacterium]|nr:ribosome biogenesis GTPase YlqF [Oscillospiraceae bacterium]
MPSENIQWFPGHMAKTRRMISENLKNVDIVIEILDARIPYSSRNPEITRLTEGKPTLLLLNKASLADPAQNKLWISRYTTENTRCLLTDCVTGEGLRSMEGAIKDILADKLRKYEEKGMSGRRVRAMVLGIPNVGKSSLINRICGNKKAKVENRPGVTLDKQWVTTGIGVDLLDMPGILWPKFEERRVGENLALTGAIRDGVLDTEALAVILCKRLRILYPDMLSTRYKLGDMAQYEELSDYDLFLTIGKKRGFLISGGEINTERTSLMLLDEFRNTKIGRITLERYSKEELHA